jgi:hypothetical protein
MYTRTDTQYVYTLDVDLCRSYITVGALTVATAAAATAVCTGTACTLRYPEKRTTVGPLKNR